jgi:hypothetical protein
MELTIHQGKPMITTEIPQFLADLEERFNRAMISNDVDAIARCITHDWILVTPEVGPVPRSRILDVIGSGRHGCASLAVPRTRARRRALRLGHPLDKPHMLSASPRQRCSRPSSTQTSQQSSGYSRAAVGWQLNGLPPNVLNMFDAETFNFCVIPSMLR